MNRLVLYPAAVVAVALAVTGCSEILGPLVGSGCAGVGYSAMRVDIRDALGNPQAFGATVALYDRGTRVEVNEHRETDTLSIHAANERGGKVYDVLVTKPYYQPTWVGGVKTPGGGCVHGGLVPEVVPVTLALVPNAPAVRSLFVLPVHVLLDRAPHQTAADFSVLIDANPGITRAVTWSVTGDTASVTFNAATGSMAYRCRTTSGYLTLKATSVADPSVSGTVDVAVQGHPGNTSDPPCA